MELSRLCVGTDGVCICREVQDGGRTSAEGLGVASCSLSQDLSFATESAGVERLNKQHQPQICAHSSMKELTTEIPNGLWDQGGIQIGTLGLPTLCKLQQVPLLGIGHEGEEVDGMEHEHLEMFTGWSLKTDWLDGVQLTQVMHHGCLESSQGRSPVMRSKGLRVRCWRRVLSCRTGQDK